MVTAFCYLAMEHIITGLSVQKRNPQRVNVHLDGEFAFGLARAVAAWLTVGQTLNDEKIAQLRADDGYEVAYHHALRFLGYRQRSQAELRQNLKEHDTPEEVIDAVVQRMVQIGLVDDTRFAQDWIDNRSEFRPRSRRALMYELKQRGVDMQTIENSLETLDEEKLALQAARKHARKLQGLDWQSFRQKMYSFLARRGFNYEVSAPVVAQVWAEIMIEQISDEEEVDI
jgi:regulatory protein